MLSMRKGGYHSSGLFPVLLAVSYLSRISMYLSELVLWSGIFSLSLAKIVVEIRQKLQDSSRSVRAFFSAKIRGAVLAF